MALEQEVSLKSLLLLALNMLSIWVSVLFCKTEIDKNYVWTLETRNVICTNQQILRFDVLVNKAILMQYFQLVNNFEADLDHSLVCESHVFCPTKHFLETRAILIQDYVAVSAVCLAFVNKLIDAARLQLFKNLDFFDKIAFLTGWHLKKLV